MPIVGIDFGTTTSAVAIAENGEARLLPDASGRTLLPTVVYLPENKAPVVGVAARNRLNLAPERSFAGIKRFLGLNYRSPAAEQLAHLFGVKLHRGPDDLAAFRVDDRLWSAADLTREVFSVLRQTATQRLGNDGIRAVVTVPAGFSYNQRTALLDAAENAGIQIEQLMNEPTAAAIAYGLNTRIGQRIAVFDLGGGTFDFTILEVQRSAFEVLSTTADPMLGSSDIDGAIAAHMADALRQQHGLVVPRDKMGRLRPAAERMKIELSSALRSSASVAARWVGVQSNAVYEVSITRDELEHLARPLIAKCMSLVKSGLRAADMDAHQIDEIILVGGGALMPLVQHMNHEFFGREPLHRIDPERVVAIGAALWAEDRQEDATTDAPKPLSTTHRLHDRSAIGLGIETIAGLIDYIIPANARVPARGVRKFTTSSDYQESIRLKVYQGTARRAENCEPIGELLLDGLPRVPRGETSVTVTFVLDSNGLVLVSAVDSLSGVAREASLQSTLHPEPKSQTPP